MFLSKIWFFLVTVIAALAITVALVMPRPAERAGLIQENKSVRTACIVTDIVLRSDARARIQLTGEFARAVRELKLSNTLLEASKGDIISGQANATGRAELPKLLDSVTGTKPSFIWLLDRRGRVVARSSLEDKSYGDSMRGYYLVKDALDGYVRDDLWMLEDGLYRVTGSPILTRDMQWAGAIVLGHAVDANFAEVLSKSIDANINFYVGSDAVASSKPVQIHKDIVEASKNLASVEKEQDCAVGEVLRVKAGQARYLAINARLPGEAGQEGAFFSIYIEEAETLDFMGTLSNVKKNDLSFDKFPWLRVALAFIAMMGIGFFLMFREVDGPLKKLNKEAVSLAQEELERFDETAHRSKYGSIARSVNINIDKMHRATKAAKKDFDQLLGPAPGDKSNAIESPLPPIGLGDSAPAAAPVPISDFKFGGVPAPAAADLGLSAPPAAMPGMTPTPSKPAIPTPAPAKGHFSDKTPPPPIPATTPPPRPTNSFHAPAGISLGADEKKSLDEDILAGPDTVEAPQFGGIGSKDADPEELPTIVSDTSGASAYFEQIYQEFMNMKRKCGESTENLTFERFSKKLQKNQDALIAKRSCSSVKFQVYEKDGKAALKASPVK